MLLKFDEKLLSTAQKFCDKMQEITGLTKFFFEKWSLIMFLLSISVEILSLYGESEHSSLIFAAGFSCSVNILVWVPEICRIEKEEMIFLRHGMLKFPRLYDFSRRFPLVGMVLLLVCLHLWVCQPPLSYFHPWIFFGGWIYFSACIPKPPGKSKLRQWLDDLNKSMQNPIPVTIR